MPDITMCNMDDCPVANQCYRHEAEPAPYYQSYFADDPREQDGTCNFFWLMGGDAA